MNDNTATVIILGILAVWFIADNYIDYLKDRKEKGR
jgi:hypothetical protein